MYDVPFVSPDKDADVVDEADLEKDDQVLPELLEYCIE
jgi:hypothetical protein